MQRILPRLACFAALLSGLFFASASAQRKELPVGIAPPQPVQLTVKVQRGGKTEIPLRIHGLANEPVKFLIRTPPTHGKVAEPRVTGRESAVAIYEPPADLSITADRFFYASQSTAGVSAAVEIAITILDQPPELTIPDTLEFPTLRTGATSSKLLEITNTGGGMASGEIIVEAPWRIEGKPGYRLGAGDIAIFKLFFAPTTGGNFEKVARFTSEPTRSTTLRGTAETSVAVHPALLVLQPGAGDPVRTGTFEITNQTDEPRTLQLQADPRLQVPPQVSLPPRGRLAVPVQTAAGDILPLEAEILLTAPDLELRVPVRAAAPGAVIRAAPRTVAFGRLPIGPPAQAEFELENIGGAAGEVTWTIGPPFRTAQTSTLLVPGEKRRFPIELAATKPGRYRAWLQWKFGTQTVDLPVEAELVAGPRGPGIPGILPPASPAAATADAPDAAPSEEPSAPRGAPAVPPGWLHDISLPPGVKVARVTSNTATIEWPVSLSPAPRFHVEARIFGYDAERKLTVTWHRFEGLPIQTQGGSYLATVFDLEPAQPWVIRVLPVPATGEPGERLFAIGFSTLPKASLVPKISPFRALLAALVILVGWQIYARWRRR